MRDRSPSRRVLLRDTSGAAGVELAMVCFLFVLFLLNGLEFARYSYQKMQVENATHAAVMAVWKACDTTKTPATTNCTSAMNAAITAGLQSTALGTTVVKDPSYPIENYYCVNSTTGKLVVVAAATASRPSDCSAQGDASHAPGDYISVKASANYYPIFIGVGVANALPSSIAATSYMRLL